MDTQRHDSDTSMRSHDRDLHLHQDSIHEILLRLPVKSLLRFRAVSKSWCALISRPSFAKAHVEKSSKDPSFRHHSVITSNHRLQRLPIPSLLSEPTTEAVDVDFLMYEGSSKNISSCNGLVCVTIRLVDFVLWNPSTRTYKNLPTLIPGNNHSVSAWGFGHVESSNDYKVFALVHSCEDNSMVHCVAKVYSLKTGSWRTIDYDSRFKTLWHDEAATYLGGKLYWLKKFTSEKRLRWRIITFDLENGEFGTAAELEQPDAMKFGDVRSLGVIDGHLCVLRVVDGHLCALRESFEVWVLKQNGLNETPSWNKMMSLPNPGDALSYSSFLKLRVADGAILGYDERNLAIYCPRDRNFRKLSVLKLGMFRFLSVHVESLVSLGSDCEAEEENCDLMMMMMMVFYE